MLARDILLTLIVKFSLLFVLWYVCVKGVEKPPADLHQWLLGVSSSSSQVVK